MNEDSTKQLPPFEERIIAAITELRTEMRNGFAAMSTRLTSLDDRLTSLEDKVDARLRETQPLLEGVQERLTSIESELVNLNCQFRTLIRDSFDLRSRVEVVR